MGSAIKTQWHATRALLAPVNIDLLSTEHARRGLGVVVLWADVGRAPPHAVGWGSTAPTTQQVGNLGFER